MYTVQFQGYFPTIGSKHTQLGGRKKDSFIITPCLDSDDSIKWSCGNINRPFTIICRGESRSFTMLLHSPKAMPKRKILPSRWLLLTKPSTELTIDDDSSSDLSLEDTPSRSVHFGVVDIVSTEEDSPPRCWRQCSVDVFETTLRRSSKQAILQQYSSSRPRPTKEHIDTKPTRLFFNFMYPLRRSAAAR